MKSAELHRTELDGNPAAPHSPAQALVPRERMLSSRACRVGRSSAPEQIRYGDFRITQGGLRYVPKHAGKTYVKAILEVWNEHMHPWMEELGAGFDQEAACEQVGTGLIRERRRARLVQGRFSVHSALGEGTTCAADLPIH